MVGHLPKVKITIKVSTKGTRQLLLPDIFNFLPGVRSETQNLESWQLNSPFFSENLPKGQQVILGAKIRAVGSAVYLYTWGTALKSRIRPDTAHFIFLPRGLL